MGRLALFAKRRDRSMSFPTIADHAASSDPKTPGRISPELAVIGAGVSGLIAARTLKAHGLNVSVFDKGRGPGGRASTRLPEPGLSFDHGAQYFTAVDPVFASQVQAWKAVGIVAEWTGRIVRINGNQIEPQTDPSRRYVGVPGMSALGRHLAADLAVRQETRIARLTRSGGFWHLSDAAGQSTGPFDKVIVALPGPQACALLGDHPLTSIVKTVQMTPCWTVMAALERPVDVPWDGAFNEGSPLVWMARDSSKPGRPASPDCWVLQASPDWSGAHQDDNPEAVSVALLDLFGRVVSSLPPVLHQAAHRWLYSATPRPLDRLTLSDPETGLVLCGDWLAGGRIEGAFRSGLAAAESMLRDCAIPPGAIPGA